MAEGKFVTAINCMDGRVQTQVVEWMTEEFKADHVDMITEPGPEAILATGGEQLASIRERVDISVNKHGSSVVAVIGHWDCAGNPADKEIQLAQIKEGVEEVTDWYDELEVVGLWVNQDWQVEKVV
ncbi:carbonic anhydrase [Halanaerobaculum tunisiense]